MILNAMFNNAGNMCNVRRHRQPIAFLVLMLVELTYFTALIVGIRKTVKA